MNDIKSTEKSQKSNLFDMDPGFVWNESSIHHFQEGLKSYEIKGQIQTLLNHTTIKPVTIASEIKSILISNAQKCKLKQKRYLSRVKTSSAPWFDRECSNTKSVLRKLGKDLRRDPNDDKTRSILCRTQKCF